MTIPQNARAPDLHKNSTIFVDKLQSYVCGPMQLLLKHKNTKLTFLAQNIQQSTTADHNANSIENRLNY